MKRRLPLALVAFSCSTAVVALTGCGLGSGVAANSTTSAAASHLFGGNIHGGQQAVLGSTVKLWAAGTTGTYGTAPTLIATTTSDANGNFGFDNTAGVSPCTTGQYLYLTAQGGNSGSGVNSQLAMMAALPTPCSATTGQQFVTINEVTTVAAVFALQQFMSITPGAAVPWSVGAPASNTVGLANAFLTTNTLANSTLGTTATTTTSNAVTATVGGVLYTTVINPDFAKINTLADILASCINTNGGAPCTTLFADTTPTGSIAPTDTIEAAFYLAQNSAGLTMPAHGNSQGSPNYLCTTYVTASAPFQPTLACSASGATTPVPADWMIGVSYKTTNNAATPATVLTITPGSVAIDAAGNVWTAADNSSATGGSIGALNVAGQVIVAPVTTTNYSTTGGWYGNAYTGATTAQPIGGARPNSLAIDTNGNSWTGAYYTTAVLNSGNPTVGSTGTMQAPLVQVTPAGVSTGYLVGQSPGALTIDGSNNIYLSNITTLPSSSSRYYASELAAAGTSSSTAAYSNFYTGTGRGTGIYAVLTVDQTASQYVTPVNGTCTANLLQNNNSIESQNTANASTNTGVNTITLATTTCVQTGAATDAKGNLWGAAAGYLEYIDTTSTGASAASPIVTQFASGTGTTQGGLDGPNNIAIDGLGNVWVANRVSSTAGGVSQFVPTTTTAGVTTLSAKSPAATAVYGFGSTYAYAGPLGVAIDPSGNVWVETGGGSYLNFLVGAAAPVVTPNALAIKNTKIGVRP